LFPWRVSRARLKQSSLVGRLRLAHVRATAT
jgi:hypothetical protein